MSSMRVIPLLLHSERSIGLSRDVDRYRRRRASGVAELDMPHARCASLLASHGRSTSEMGFRYDDVRAEVRWRLGHVSIGCRQDIIVGTRVEGDPALGAPCEGCLPHIHDVGGDVPGGGPQVSVFSESQKLGYSHQTEDREKGDRHHEFRERKPIFIE